MRTRCPPRVGLEILRPRLLALITTLDLMRTLERRLQAEVNMAPLLRPTQRRTAKATLAKPLGTTASPRPPRRPTTRLMLVLSRATPRTTRPTRHRSSRSFLSMLRLSLRVPHVSASMAIPTHTLTLLASSILTTTNNNNNSCNIIISPIIIRNNMLTRLQMPLPTRTATHTAPPLRITVRLTPKLATLTRVPAGIRRAEAGLWGAELLHRNRSSPRRSLQPQPTRRTCKPIFPRQPHLKPRALRNSLPMMSSGNSKVLHRRRTLATFLPRRLLPWPPRTQPAVPQSRLRNVQKQFLRFLVMMVMMPRMTQKASRRTARALAQRRIRMILSRSQLKGLLR
eukprot:Rmarinus@m.13893